MKAVITYLDSIFDEDSFQITLYAKSRKDILGVCYALGRQFVLTNVYITDPDEKKDVNKED